MASFIEHLKIAAKESLGDAPQTQNLVQKSITSGAIISESPYRKPFFRRWNTDKAIAEGYDASEWVKTCVDRIAVPAASVPWRVSRFTSTDAKRRMQWEIKGMRPHEKAQYISKSHFLEPEPNHPLEQLIDEPNPFFDKQGMMERLTQYLLLGGNGIWTKVRDRSGTVVELWPLPPDLVTPNPDKKKFIRDYTLKVPEGKEEIIRVEDIIHMMLPDPANLYWGISVLKAAAMVVDSDVEALKWQKSSLENRAVPDAVITFNAGEMSPEEFEETRRQTRIQYQGRDNARTPILIAGEQAKYHQLTLSPVEMDFIQSRKMNRESICAVFSVDPAIAGIKEGSTYGTIKEIKRDHWVSVILPFLDRVQAVLNRQLAREFGRDLLIWYDTSNVEALADSFHDKVRSAALLGRLGFSGKALNRRLELGFTADETRYLEDGLVPASTRSIREIYEGLNEPDVGEGAENPNSLPDGGEVIDVEPEPEPVGELDPAGADSNKASSLAYLLAEELEAEWREERRREEELSRNGRR